MAFFKSGFTVVWFLEVARQSPYMQPKPTAQINNTWRLPGWLRASCGWHLRAVRQCHRHHLTGHSGVARLHNCATTASGCRLHGRSSVNISIARPGTAAQAPRAGRARSPWSCTPCRCLSRDAHEFRDQVQLDGEAYFTPKLPTTTLVRGH